MKDADIKVKNNSVAIIGFHDGSAGQIETWFEETSGYHIACFVHEAAESLNIDADAENRKRVSKLMSYPTKDSFKGRPLLVAIDWLDRLEHLGINKILPLSPDNYVRRRQIQACRLRGMELVSAIHPSAQILAGGIIAPGVWINAGSLIGYKAEIESGVIINTGVQVDHHNVLKECCQLDPGVVTAGNVTLRECCHLHTAATVINRIEIGHGAVIGAGAVVIRNIAPYCQAVGVPAKVIKTRPPQSCQ